MSDKKAQSLAFLHVGPRLTGGARLSQLRVLDLQADEKGCSLIKLK